MNSRGGEEEKRNLQQEEISFGLPSSYMKRVPPRSFRSKIKAIPFHPPRFSLLLFEVYFRNSLMADKDFVFSPSFWGPLIRRVRNGQIRQRIDV